MCASMCVCRSVCARAVCFTEPITVDDMEYHSSLLIPKVFLIQLMTGTTQGVSQKLSTTQGSCLVGACCYDWTRSKP